MGEFDLSEAERAQVASDCSGIIVAADTTAAIYRVEVEGNPGFDGPALQVPDLVQAGLPIEFRGQPSSDILEPECDAVADAPGDWTDEIEKEAMRAVIGGKNYRIRHVQPFSLGGVETFTRLQLTREYP